MQDEFQNIQVILRVRPFNQNELRDQNNRCLFVLNDCTVALRSQPEDKTFHFDYVADEHVTQDDLFIKVAKPLAQYCVSGFNCCLFAYGQTGSGKTHTMTGKISVDICPESGLQLRVMQYLFGLVGRNRETFFQVRCSYFEIYNEQIFDLLAVNGKQLKIRQDLKKGTYVENLCEEHVDQLSELIQVIQKGQSNRKTASTLMNAQSSRSHSVFQVTVESKATHDGMDIIRCAKLNFVDLAGSERQKQTGATDNRLKEANFINKSLMQLGTVISQLVKLSGTLENQHISYRNSKLTHLLQDSLGGNSRTIMIATASSASDQYFETLSTLKFTQSVKLVKNQAKVNEKISSTKIKRLQEEIVNLKQKVEQMQSREPKQSDSQLAVYLQQQFTHPMNQLVHTIAKIYSSRPCETDLVLMEQEVKLLLDYQMRLNSFLESVTPQYQDIHQQELQQLAHRRDKLEHELRDVKECHAIELQRVKQQAQQQIEDNEVQVARLKEELASLHDSLKFTESNCQNIIQERQKELLNLQQMHQTALQDIDQLRKHVTNLQRTEKHPRPPTSDELVDKKLLVANTERDLYHLVLKNIKEELIKFWVYSVTDKTQWKQEMFNVSLLGQPLFQQIDLLLKICLGSKKIDIIKTQS